MINSDAAIRYFEAVYAMKPIYLWGADMEVITKKLLDKLIKKHGAEQYKKVHLEIHEGLYGSDCSGLFKNISGFDTTAEGYYNKCSTKGLIKYVPKNKVLQIFREEKGKITHVAALDSYTWTLYEMRNGCEKRKFNPSEWTYYGVPDWIKQKNTVTLKKDTQVYMSASDAIEGRVPVATYKAGEYIVYKRVTGAVNITKTEGKPGGWIAVSDLS